MILNSMAVKKAIFIDLPHFLIRQMIVNSDLNCDQSYLAPNFAANIRVDGRVVFINQDSFPEISSEWVNKYLAIADDAAATEVFSYNKVDRSYGHANYHAVLAKHQLQRCYISSLLCAQTTFLNILKDLVNQQVGGFVLVNVIDIYAMPRSGTNLLGSYFSKISGALVNTGGEVSIQGWHMFRRKYGREYQGQKNL